MHSYIAILISILINGRKKDFVHKDSPESKELTRDNHYVPQWYQKGFIPKAKGAKLHYLDLNPDEIKLPNVSTKRHNANNILPLSQCFYEYDLYTTFFGPFISDIIESKLFGEIDSVGSLAVKAFINGSPADRQQYFLDFFRYIDAQKTRTPKGLSWLKQQYDGLDQITLMGELEAIQQMNCTMWIEGTRENVSAKQLQINLSFLTDNLRRGLNVVARLRRGKVEGR